MKLKELNSKIFQFFEKIHLFYTSFLETILLFSFGAG
jgi:hypothetical protein